jgi:chromosome segregation ATPase
MVADGVVDLLTRSKRLSRNMEKLMADFNALRAALEEQRTELVAAVDRVAQDVQALQDKISELELDTADQQQINELAAQVRESVETLRGIDPVAAVDENPPDEEPGTEPGGETPAEPTPGEQTEAPERPASPTPDTDEFGNPVR